MCFSLLRRWLAIVLAASAAFAAFAVMGSAGSAGASTEFGSQVAATQWTQTNPPAPPDSIGYDSGVSCVSSTFCVATVFQYNPSDGGGTDAVVQVWNGATWTTVPVPAPAGATEAELEGVSCTSKSFCIVVGYGVDADDTALLPLVDQWNGSSWSNSALTVASGYTSAQLIGVSCTGPAWCMATGLASDGLTGASVPWAEQWNGSTWSFSATPALTSGDEAEFTAVSCTGPANCMAVGGTSTDDSPNALPGPGSSGSASFMQKLATPTTPTTPTVHANATSHATPSDQALAEHWNGSTWTVTSTIDPAGVTEAILGGVSCAGGDFCMATSYIASVAFAEVWSGGVWSQTSVPAAPSGDADFIYGVSCISSTSCTSVGEIQTAETAADFLSASWNGSGWSFIDVAPPAGETEATWLAVSCLSGGSCVATGATANGASDDIDTTVPSNAQAPVSRTGYRLAASDGGVFSYGPTAPSLGAPFAGSMGGQHLNAPIVGMATVPSGDGYYLVASDGGVFNFGSAQFYGSAGGTHLNEPIVGIAVTADGGGYWLVAADGGVFSYGDAQFYGSTGGTTLNKPIVGMAATPNGLGYYLVASDGGIFSYGNATFAGSMGGRALNKPIVGMAVTAAGGYYLVGADGGIFNFGGAPLLGSAGSLKLNQPIVGMGVALGGYYLVASDGGIFAYPGGGAPPLFFGSAGGIHLNGPIVGIGT